MSVSITPKAALGYRIWKLEDNSLLSLSLPNSWEGKNTQAVCLKHSSNHKAPQADCDCGLYAYKEFGSAVRSLCSHWHYFGLHYLQSPDYQTKFLIGLVAGRGQSYVYEQGFRSEEMSIVALTDLPAKKDLNRWAFKNISNLDLIHSYTYLNKYECSMIEEKYCTPILETEQFISLEKNLDSSSFLTKEL